jgi:UDP-N-acetylglucosamine--N-acetylmuramyl-(pentapeptide) pyrophosphoryl-undecaprenol N-acetylglucosamine transferase
MSSPKTALIMAGGTGGHIFPAWPWPRSCGARLARALAGRARQHGVAHRAAAGLCRWRPSIFSACAARAEDAGAAAAAPAAAFWQALPWCAACSPMWWWAWAATSPSRRPDGRAAGKPLVLHEQNSVAGMANKVLAGVADRVFTAFPGVFKKANGWATRCARPSRGRPARPSALPAAGPCACWWWAAAWARALNDIVPQALALLPEAQRPRSAPERRRKTDRALRAYQAAGVQAELTPFIDDTAAASPRPTSSSAAPAPAP